MSKWRLNYTGVHNLHFSKTLSFTNGSVSFSTAEFIAILEALICISSLTPGNYLLISDFQINLLAITENLFHSKCFPIILKIRSLLLSLNSKFFSIYFLWVSGHIYILRNVKAVSLARSTTNVFPFGPLCVLILNLIHRRIIHKL